MSLFLIHVFVSKESKIIILLLWGIRITEHLNIVARTFFYFLIEMHLLFIIQNNFHLPFLKLGLLLADWQATILSAVTVYMYMYM